MSYGKTFDSLYTGSMVGAGLHVFGVWNYVIANSKPPGVVELNPRLMAAIFGCEVSLVIEAIRVLCEPDPESRSKECEGRRLIHEGQFLYSIPTWSKYNQLRNEEERRAQNREHARAYRQRKSMVASGSESDASATVRESQDVLSTSTSTASDEVSKPPKVEQDPQFTAFWSAYDKKVGIGEASKAWKRLAPDAALAKTIIEAAGNYRSDTPDKAYRKNPATWLNQKGWLDERIVPLVAGKPAPGSKLGQPTVEHPRGMPIPYESPLSPCRCAMCEKARAKRVAT